LHTQILVYSPLLSLISTLSGYDHDMRQPLSPLFVTSRDYNACNEHCISVLYRLGLNKRISGFANSIHYEYGWKPIDTLKQPSISFYTDSNAWCTKMISNTFIHRNLIIHGHITSAKSRIWNKRGIFSDGRRGQGQSGAMFHHPINDSSNH
jgi:hypothetical protein